MESRTELGTNRTGMQISPDADDMLENIKLTKPRRGDERGMAKIRAEYGDQRYHSGHFPAATELFMRMSKSAEFDEFLSLPAYELLP